MHCEFSSALSSLYYTEHMCNVYCISIIYLLGKNNERIGTVRVGVDEWHLLFLEVDETRYGYR